MTANDKRLIEKAYGMDWADGNWNELMAQCDSEEARQQISGMEMEAYHREEASIGCI